MAIMNDYFDFYLDWGWPFLAHRSSKGNPGVTFIYLFGKKLRIDHKFWQDSNVVFQFDIRYNDGYLTLHTLGSHIGILWHFPWRKYAINKVD
jgi:hypothetical protein